MTLGTPAEGVTVVGGGLAGLTAALVLADAGYPVTLLEARTRLGGATFSFDRGGLPVDNGQHVFLRCCTAYRWLLDRLGVTDRVQLQPRFALTVLRPGHRPARLRPARLPAPWHLLPAIAGYRPLTVTDRWRVVRAAVGLRGEPGPGDDGLRFGDWLTDAGQRPAAVRRLWELIGTPALNLPVGEASFAAAAFVLRTALLTDRHAADIGYPLVPLSELHGRPAAAALARAGATVRCGCRVTAVRLAGGGLRLTTAGGAQLATSAVVLAVPAWQAGRLLPAAVLPDAPRLTPSPIVNVHVLYDRPVTALRFAAAVDSPVQWLFDRSAPAGLAPGRYLAVTLSAADRWLAEPVARLRETFLPALGQLLPATGAARVVDFFVTREPAATFRPVPGAAAARPLPATRHPRLALAGSWTATGWPDSMESAVRAGLAAARLVARQVQPGATPVSRPLSPAVGR